MYYLQALFELMQSATGNVGVMENFSRELTGRVIWVRRKFIYMQIINERRTSVPFIDGERKREKGERISQVRVMEKG